MKKLLILIFVLILLPQTVLAGFTDVQPSDPDYDEIMRLYNEGIIQGYSPTEFGPDDTITRAELLKIAIEGAHILDYYPDSYDLPFSDVSTSHSLYSYILFAYKQNMVKGYADGTFRPDQPVTFAEATKILLTLQDYKPLSFEGGITSYVFVNDGTLDSYYATAAQQNLYEMTYNDYKTELGTFVKRRDIARAMANILKLKDWNDIPTGPLYDCTTFDQLSSEQKNMLETVPFGFHSTSEICIADEINLGFGITFSPFDTPDNLAIFSLDPYMPVHSVYKFVGLHSCTVGARQGLLIEFNCIRDDGIEEDQNFFYNFVTNETLYYGNSF